MKKLLSGLNNKDLFVEGDQDLYQEMEEELVFGVTEHSELIALLLNVLF